MEKLIGNPIEKEVTRALTERAKWMDETIYAFIPEWKITLLKNFPYEFLKKILGINIEIIHETLIGNFGTRIIIKNNNKVIGSRSFMYEK